MRADGGDHSDIATLYSCIELEVISLVFQFKKLPRKFLCFDPSSVNADGRDDWAKDVTRISAPLYPFPRHASILEQRTAPPYPS